MNSPRSFFEEDENDSLLFEKLQNHVLEKYPHPEREGCLDASILETWVNSPQNLDLSDPKYLHVLKCAECTRELIERRKLRDERAKIQLANQAAARPNWRLISIVGVLACSIALGAIAYWRMHSSTSSVAMTSVKPVALTIDLSRLNTQRGEKTQTVPRVTLPRRMVVAHIILPHFSPAGKYLVSVTKDEDAHPAKAEGIGDANMNGSGPNLTVTLDLRSLPRGEYYLATVHEGDRVSYSCPLIVQ